MTLAKKMQKDGLVPFAFADKDQWPALGMFDILNLRINGFDYHIKLMHNKASYTDPQVTARVQPVERADALPAERRRPAGSGRTPPRPWSPSRRA